jgi:hypothetical protein
MRAARSHRARRVADLAKRLAGALILGVAAILLPKTQVDQHWSDPPVIELTVEHDQAARSGDDPRSRASGP